MPDADAPSNALVAVLNSSSLPTHTWANTYCGAVLVAPDAAVSATHCLNDGPLPDVLIGASDLCADEPEGERIEVSGAVRGTGDAEGLVLLRFSESAASPPAQLASRASETGMFATGWGRSSVEERRPCEAKRIGLESTDDGACEGAVSAAKDAGVALGSHACLSPTGHRNTCVGDSGSGVYSVSDSGLIVHGITLGGLGCDEDQAGLYGDVTAIRALLEQAGLEIS